VIAEATATEDQPRTEGNAAQQKTRLLFCPSLDLLAAAYLADLFLFFMPNLRRQKPHTAFVLVRVLLQLSHRDPCSRLWEQSSHR
jgi:hypothetical protein